MNQLILEINDIRQNEHFIKKSLSDINIYVLLHTMESMTHTYIK